MLLRRHLGRLQIQLEFLQMSGKAIHSAAVWSCLAHGGWRWIVPQRVNWWRGEKKPSGREKFSFLTSLSCLKEMWVGSAGEAWRLMLQKGALTASPLVAVLLGGPIGLGCHFCYLILCMWTRQIQRGWCVCVCVCVCVSGVEGVPLGRNRRDRLRRT